MGTRFLGQIRIVLTTMRVGGGQSPIRSVVAAATAEDPPPYKEGTSLGKPFCANEPTARFLLIINQEKRTKGIFMARNDDFRLQNLGTCICQFN